jgi:leader peptidase (prepilin peptidase) / N-methyltransferase
LLSLSVLICIGADMFWPDLFAYTFVFVLGAAIGSFLNVVIYRIPEGLSLLHPPSRCPYCLTRLKPHENVPILGWFWLRGRCAHCHTPISFRYPLIEAITGGLFVFIFWTQGWTWLTPGYWILFSWLLSLALIDIDTMTLPNPLTQWGLLVGLGFQTFLAVQQQAGQPEFAWSLFAQSLLDSIFGIIVGIWLFDLIGGLGKFFLKKDAMGGGDGKLAAMIGAWLGWQMVLVTTFLACAIGSVIGVSAIALGRLGRRQPMPFGPSIALAAAIAALYGKFLLSTHLSWIGFGS